MTFPAFLLPIILSFPMMPPMRFLLLTLLAALFATGCGTIHIGTEEHIHVFPNGRVVSEDAQTEQLYQWIVTIRRQMTSSQDTPMQGFRWDEEEILRNTPKKEGEDI